MHMGIYPSANRDDHPGNVAVPVRIAAPAPLAPSVSRSGESNGIGLISLSYNRSTESASDKMKELRELGVGKWLHRPRKGGKG